MFILNTVLKLYIYLLIKHRTFVFHLKEVHYNYIHIRISSNTTLALRGHIKLKI